MQFLRPWNRIPEVVGNKAKGRISELVLQKNKARQISPKNEHFLPPDMLTYFYASLLQTIS